VNIRLKILFVIFLFFNLCYGQDVWVEGYYRKNGTYVEGHYRTRPNNTNSDNFSTKPNLNPYTGKKGTIKSDGGIPYYHTKQNKKPNNNENVNSGYSYKYSNSYKSSNLSYSNKENKQIKQKQENKPITFGRLVGEIFVFIGFIGFIGIIFLGIFGE
jgi:hypothetical protein